MSDPVIIFDLETSSTQPDCEITQIGAIAVANGQTLSEFEIKLKFNVEKADPDALRVQNYSPERWLTAVEPAQACREFASWLKPFKCVEKVSKRTGNTYKVARGCGYNTAAFDAPRLHELYRKHDIFLPMAFDTLDVFQLAKWYFFLSDGAQPADLKLGTVAEHFAINLHGYHDALVDCHGTAQIAREICKRLEVVNS